jgi:hypothetical protein
MDIDFNAKPAYTCSKCGMGVIVIPNEKPIKACNCNAPIVTNLETVIIGRGKVTG